MVSVKLQEPIQGISVVELQPQQGNVVFVDLHSLVIHEDIYGRAYNPRDAVTYNLYHILKLKDAIIYEIVNTKKISKIPPLAIAKFGDKYYIIDGVHRHKALLEVGINKFYCEVVNIQANTFDEFVYKAALLSLKYNSEHGLPISDEDVEKVIKTIVEKYLPENYNATHIRKLVNDLAQSIKKLPSIIKNEYSKSLKGIADKLREEGYKKLVEYIKNNPESYNDFENNDEIQYIINQFFVFEELNEIKENIISYATEEVFRTEATKPTNQELFVQDKIDNIGKEDRKEKKENKELFEDLDQKKEETRSAFIDDFNEEAVQRTITNITGNILTLEQLNTIANTLTGLAKKFRTLVVDAEDYDFYDNDIENTVREIYNAIDNIEETVEILLRKSRQ
jgi:hypothetical protein